MSHILQRLYQIQLLDQRYAFQSNFKFVKLLLYLTLQIQELADVTKCSVNAVFLKEILKELEFKLEYNR